MSEAPLTAHLGDDVERAEQPLLDAGPVDGLMRTAAFGLAVAVRRAMRRRALTRRSSTVALLVGGGNNGGDALYAGAVLARWGIDVRAVLIGERTHPRALVAARSAGVRCYEGTAELEHVAGAAVWVDALTGIGARHGLRAPAAALVTRLQGLREAHGALVVAVDVPSGIGVDDGTVPGPVLRADLTVTMGAAKPGLLLPPAALAAGEVRLVTLGLDLQRTAPAVRRLDRDGIAALLHHPVAEDDKYRRGVLGLLTGSDRYPGAAVLGASGALGAGTGMLRYIGPRNAQHLVMAAAPEVVAGHGRVQAWAMGSGIDPDDADRAAELRTTLGEARERRIPVALDAGGIALAPDDLDATTVLTPHAGELAALLTARGHEAHRADVEARPAEHLHRAVDLTGATVLLKGAVTLVAGPGTSVYSQAPGTPWLATAGTGDVLTGVLGALLASLAAAEERGTAPEPDEASRADLVARTTAAAAALHGLAASHASGGGPITAAGVAAALPPVVADLLHRRSPERRR